MASLLNSRRMVSSKEWESPSCCGSFLLNRCPTSNLGSAPARNINFVRYILKENHSALGDLEDIRPSEAHSIKACQGLYVQKP